METAWVPVILCHLFYEGDGTSACKSRTLFPLSKPLVPTIPGPGRYAFFNFWNLMARSISRSASRRRI